MSIIQRVPWTVQPQVPVGANWGNPLARGLAVAVVPSISPSNLILPDVAAGLLRAGAAIDGVFTSTPAVISTNPRLSTTTFSFYLLFLSGPTLGATECLIGRGPNDSGTNNIGFGFNSNHGNAAYAGAIYAGSAYTVIGKPTGGAIAVNTRYSIGGTFDGSNGRGYNNGLLTVGPTAVSGINTTARLTLNRNSADAAPNNDDGKFYVVLYWDRTLSDAEMAQVHNNPWQVLAPQTRRIWVPVSAGGGTTITGALGTATASGLTATIGANTGIAGALGTAVASGLTATVNANTTITGALGTATASGFTATVDANRTISGALGTATASGLTGTVSNSNDTVIGGALGIAVASGLLGTVAWNRSIEGALGTAAASGLRGTVSTAGALTDAEFRQMYDWISELHLIHGLRSGSPMTVTPTTRVAGAVSQTIGEVSTTITVTRV